MSTASNRPARNAMLAGVLDGATESMIDRYEGGLLALESRLLGDPHTRAQVIGQARTIIGDISLALRDEPGQVSMGRDLARDVGTARAHRRIHPSESLRAAIVLFDVIMQTAAEAAPDEVAGSALLELSVAANRVISQRIRMAASSYVGALLAGIEHSHLLERQRLSRELHDRIGGGIAAAHRQVELLDAGSSADIAERSGRIDAALRSALEDVRNLIGDLRTWKAEQEGLEASLLAHLDGLQPDDLAYRIDVNGDEHGLDDEVRTGVFMILREAIRNTVRHARASQLLVQVNITPHELYAVVEDNGIGAEFARSPVGSAHAGLSSMRERAALLEGEIVVTGQPGRGTRIELLVASRRPSWDDGDE